VKPQNFNERARQELTKLGVTGDTRVVVRAALSTVWGRTQRGILVVDSCVSPDNFSDTTETPELTAVVLRANTNPKDYHIQIDRRAESSLEPGESIAVDQNTRVVTVDLHLAGTQEDEITHLSAPMGYHFAAS